MTDLGPRSFRFTVLLVLLGASLFLALPALRGDVLGIDDQELLLGSGTDAGALHMGPGEFFTGRYYYAYLPFYGLTYWVDGKLGAGPGSTLLFHFQNVLWHALASYLVFCILGLLLRHRWAAFLGAFLFAAHPLHVESVAWIAGRKDVMSGCLFFAAWLLAILAERRRGLVALSLLCFLVACFTKASAVVLPPLLLAAALLLPRYRGTRREAALRTWPWFVAAVVPIVVHLVLGIQAGVVTESRSLPERLAAFVASWGGAVQRTLLPFDLSLDYPEVRAAAGAALLLPGLLLAGALVAGLALRKRAPVAAFGIAAFFVLLLPFNNVFPATQVLAADRYLYLPLFGAALLGALVLARFPRGGAVLAAWALVLFGFSVAGASRFRSTEELWTSTIAARDGSAQAWINRGLDRTARALRARPPDEKLLAEAVSDLEAGLARRPLREHQAIASSGLVLPLLHLGRPQEALERGRTALDIAADAEGGEARRFRAQIHYNRGVVYKLGLGAHEPAAQEFVASSQLWPRYQAFFEAGRELLQAGHVDEGKRALERAAEIDPAAPEPWLDLATMYAQLDDRAACRRALDEASRRQPEAPEVVQARVSYWLEGDAPDYRKAAEELERLDPRNPLRQRLAAGVEAQRALYLFRRGAEDEAVAAADRARGLGCDLPSVLYELGQIYLFAQRFDDAIACYRAASDLFERDSTHRDAVARACALKACALLAGGDRTGAAEAMRTALDARPEVIEAGAAPLRGEIALLREAGDPRLLLLAAAAVAGDPALGRRICDELFAATDLSPADRLLVYRLRALLRAFTTFDFAGAEDDLRQVLAADPQDRWARYRLAEAWMRSGVAWRKTGEQIGSAERTRQGTDLLDEAIGLYGELLAEDPDFHLARLARGEARFLAGDLAGAKADYLALRERGVGLKEVYLKEAVLHRLVYVRGGDAANLESARALLERALAIDPNYFEALFELGNVHQNLYDRGDDPALQRKMAFNRAAFWYRRAMALNPRVAEPRTEWGRLLVKAAREAVAAGEVKTAHELLLRVEEEAPDLLEARKERARLALRPDYAKATGLGPDIAFDQAREAIEAVEKAAPGDPDLPALRSLYHRTRGYSFYLTWARYPADTAGAHKERARELAIQEFQAAFAAWPGDPDNASVRDRLRELAPEVIIIDQEKAREAYERGSAAFQAGRWADAVAAFREAVLLFPESVDLRYYYAVSLLKDGQREAGRDELQLVANHPDGRRYPEALLRLGDYYLLEGKALIARPWYERYVALMEELGRGQEEEVVRARAKLAELRGGG